MSRDLALPREAPGRVLPTLNPDGTRRWIRPRLAPGRFLRRRRVMAWALIALFALVPYIPINGKPAILLDVVRRRFTLLGTTFDATDTFLLALLLLGIFLAIFLLTAIVGRVWCGWACPQTVYMEFLYRPIERLVARPALRYAAYLVASMFLAHTFLAYFVGVETLARWLTRSPVEHPVAFAVMAATTALMVLDFGYFREQVCIVACPYGRLQSVLLDRRSLVVGYDARRGEPRRKLRRRAAGEAPTAAAASGDCIDCGACVTTCPTGIDIRDGLQMECIHCTQCIDACDAIMDRVGRPRGLVRYSSRDELAGAPRAILRPRIVLYPLLLLAVWGGLAWALTHRAQAEVTVLRAIGAPFVVLPSGAVSNQIRVKIANRTTEVRRYRIEIAGDERLELVAPENPLSVAASGQKTTSVFVIAPRDAFTRGELPMRFRVGDDADFATSAPYRLLGPSAESAR